MLKVGEAKEVKIMLLDNNGNPTSATISYIVYDEADASFATGNMTAVIGVTGLYTMSFTPDAAGVWSIVFDCVDPNRTAVKCFDVGLGVEQDNYTAIIALENKLKATPSVNSILFKSGGATCPSSKSIWDALGNGTVDLNDIYAAIGGGILGTVSDGAPAALDFDTDLTESSNDHYNNVVIVFTSGNLIGQSRRIKDYDGASKNIILHTAFTEAPANGDAFYLEVENYSDLIGRTKGLDDIHDDLVLLQADVGDFSAQSNLQTLLAVLGVPDVSGKSFYVCLITDRLDNGTYGLSALKTEIDANETKIDTLITNLATHVTALGTHDTDIKADLGDFSGQSNLTSLLAALGIPDVAAKSLYTCLITDRLDHGTYGLSAIKILIDAIQTDLGDFSGYSNFASLLAALGIPDVAGKDLYTLLVTDRLDHGTYGLSALQTEINANETKIDTLTTNLGTHATALGTHDTAIKALLEHGTYGLSALETLVDEVESLLKNVTYGLNALKTEIDANETKIDDLDGDLVTHATALGTHDTGIKALLEHGTYGLSALETLVDEVESLLKNVTYGLSALKTEIDANETKIDDLDGDLVTHATALGTHDTAIKALLEHATYGLAVLEALIDDIETWLGNPSGDTLTTITAKFGDLSESLTAILETFTSNSSGGLGDRIAFIQSLIQTDSTVNGAAGTVDKFDTNLTEASDDHYNGLILMFTGGNLAGQSRLIIDYDGTTKEVTVHPSLTEAPADTNAFVIFTGGFQNAIIEGSKGLEQTYDLVDQLHNLNRVGDTITTDGTEQNLWINEDPVFPMKAKKLIVDFTAHTATETVEIKEYYKIKDGGAWILKSNFIFVGGVDPDLVPFELEPNLYGVKLTIEKTAGTNRSYDYEVFFEER